MDQRRCWKKGYFFSNLLIHHIKQWKYRQKSIKSPKSLLNNLIHTFCQPISIKCIKLDLPHYRTPNTKRFFSKIRPNRPHETYLFELQTIKDTLRNTETRLSSKISKPHNYFSPTDALYPVHNSLNAHLLNLANTSTFRSFNDHAYVMKLKNIQIRSYRTLFHFNSGLPPCHIPVDYVFLRPRQTFQVTSISHFQCRRYQSSNNLGFWKTLNIKTKIILMGQVRPWRIDDFLALFSWIFVGQTIFILVGTTTFVSIILFVANSLQFQEYLVRQIGDYLSEETGFKITFESAQVPRWRNGVIRLTDVSVICNAESWTQMKQEEQRKLGLPELKPEEIDLNWTYWDMKIQNVDVTLSLWRWLEGRGFVTECRLKGIRGDIDRRHVVYDEGWEPHRRTPQPGDFELDKFVVDDLLLTIRNPNFRPFSISIFHGESPQLRKQWLLYDLMCANHMVGLFDNCLFSVHKPHIDATSDIAQTWSKISHLKVSGISIDHLNAGTTGPFSWITKGTIDLDLELMIPKIGEESVVHLLKEEFQELQYLAKDKLGQVWNKTSTKIKRDLNDLVDLPGIDRISHRNYSLSKFSQQEQPKLEDNEIQNKNGKEDEQLNIRGKERKNDGNSDVKSASEQNVVMKWHVQLKDLKASVPLATTEISIFSNALIRPIIAYMNAHRTCIPISFPTCMKLNNFDGAWTIYDSHLVDALSIEVGSALTRLVMNERVRAKQLKKVGWWSFTSLTKNLTSVVVDYSQPE